MDSKRIKALLMAGVTLFVSGCSAVSQSGYVGYKKNEMKYGKAVTGQFRSAIYYNNVEWLSEFMAEYPEFNINYYSNSESQYDGHDYETIKVICSASAYENPYLTNEMLEFLLQNGLDPNIKFSNGHYALDKLCADYNYIPYLVKTLTENGADPNNANSAGFYNIDLGISNQTTLYLPIYWAIYKPMYTNGEDLLKHGASANYEILDDVHDHNIDGSAKPYQLAFKRYLEETGESPFTKAEEYAILGESDKLIEELKNGEELNEEAALVVKKFICSFGNVEALKVWNDIYYDKVKTKFTTYLLMIAANERNYEVFKYQYYDCIDDMKNFTINSSLECAAKAGSYDICKFLLENGPFQERTDYNELLRFAYQSGDADTFRLLANYINDRNLLSEKDIYKIFFTQAMEWSPFTKAVIDCLMDDCGFKMTGFSCYHTDYETIKYLFEKGKPLSVFDLPMAVVSHDTQAVEFLFEQGADPNQNVYKILLGLDPKEVESYFLPYDEALTALDGRKTGCLRYAIKHGTSEIVQQFIDHGVDLSSKHNLSCAIYNSSKATFDALFNAGASLDYRDDEEKETLVDAAKSMGRNDIVKILRKAGVKGYGGF